MIIFGTKGKTVAGPRLDGIKCPNCENESHITFGVLRYFHIFWIPVFPTSKIVGMECLNCKHALIGKELPNELKAEIKKNVFSKKHVLSAFAGLILLTLLIAGSIFTAEADKKKELAFIENPVVKDLYLVNFTSIFPDADPKYKYGVMRVKSISANDVEFQVGAMVYNKKSGPRKDVRNKAVNNDNYYAEGTIFLNASKLKDLRQGARIYSIERN